LADVLDDRVREREVDVVVFEGISRASAITNGCVVTAGAMLTPIFTP
jgi:hypothetical protein